MRSIFMLIFLFLFCSSAVSQEIFIWRDESGQTHSSETKPPNWKEDSANRQWESYETPEQARERKIIGIIEDQKSASPSAEIKERREINLEERREQATQQATEQAVEKKMNEMEDRLNRSLVITPDGAYPVIVPREKHKHNDGSQSEQSGNVGDAINNAKTRNW